MFGNRQKSYDYMVVGLGNPGEKYAGNRHNVGWMTADALCRKYKVKIKRTSTIYMTADINMFGKDILVCYPTTYMNNSGEAVRKLAEKHNINPNNIIVVVDEYNFPVGRVHCKNSGSDGGHNGIGSVIDELERTDFIRLRLGIDKNFDFGGLVDYVLSDFTEKELVLVDIMLGHAVDAIEYIVKVGLQRAMSDINSEKLWVTEEEVV